MNRTLKAGLAEVYRGKQPRKSIICLGDGVLIVGDTNREAIDALDSQELKINLIDISEFVKGAGGPNCLIMPVEREFT